jgi:hypothetical protein
MCGARLLRNSRPARYSEPWGTGDHRWEAIGFLHGGTDGGEHAVPSKAERQAAESHRQRVPLHHSRGGTRCIRISKECVQHLHKAAHRVWSLNTLCADYGSAYACLSARGEHFHPEDPPWQLPTACQQLPRTPGRTASSRQGARRWESSRRPQPACRTMGRDPDAPPAGGVGCHLHMCDRIKPDPVPCCRDVNRHCNAYLQGDCSSLELTHNNE